MILRRGCKAQPKRTKIKEPKRVFAFRRRHNGKNTGVKGSGKRVKNGWYKMGRKHRMEAKKTLK